MNQPCQHCFRGLTLDTREVCKDCEGTGFEVEKKLPVKEEKKENKEVKEVPKFFKKRK